MIHSADLSLEKLFWNALSKELKNNVHCCHGSQDEYHIYL